MTVNPKTHPIRNAFREITIKNLPPKPDQSNMSTRSHATPCYLLFVSPNSAWSSSVGAGVSVRSERRRVMQRSTAVELTKVRYYDGHKNHEDDLQVPPITRHTYQDANREAIIKRNVFGHRWVLKINDEEQEDDRNTHQSKIANPRNLKVVVYVLVFCCIIVAVCFGFYFSLGELFIEGKRRKY